MQDISYHKKIDTLNITYILISIKNNFRNETKTMQDSRYNVYIEYELYNNIMRDPSKGRYIKHIGSVKYNIYI